MNLILFIYLFKYSMNLILFIYLFKYSMNLILFIYLFKYSMNLILFIYLFKYSMNLQEEVDTLRVSLREREATVQELKVCLEQEKEGEMSRNILKLSQNKKKINLVWIVCI